MYFNCNTIIIILIRRHPVARLGMCSEENIYLKSTYYAQHNGNILIILRTKATGYWIDYNSVSFTFSNLNI